MPVVPAGAPGPTVPTVPSTGGGDDPRVVQDWAPLTFALSAGWNGSVPEIVNSSAFDTLSWTEGDPGRWTITWTDVSTVVDGYEEMPQLQFEPGDLFTSTLANGQTIEISIEIISASVPTGWGVGPAVGSIYGDTGQANIGSTTGGCVMAAALEGGGAGNARSIDMRFLSEVVRDEFDWPVDYTNVGLIFGSTSRMDDSSQSRTPVINLCAYYSDGSLLFADATTGSSADIDPADQFISVGLYSRYDAAPSGSYSMVLEMKYRLLDPVAFPS